MIDETDWDSLLSFSNINSAWEAFSHKFLSIMKECIPTGTCPKKRSLPWITKDVRKIILKRKALHRRAKKRGWQPDEKKIYNMYRNKVVSLLRSGKRDHFKKLRTASPKEFWKSIKQLTKSHQSSIPTMSHEGKTATSSKDKAEMVNDYFSTCFNTMVPPLDDPTSLPTCIGSLELDPDKCPSDLLCTEEEVYKLLVNLDVTKANGPDGISAKMLKKTASSIYPVLTNLFNQSIKSGQVPTAWKFSSVVPIPKGNEDASSPKNYRPISLLSIISKVLERLIHGKVLKHLQDSNILSHVQWGFSAGKSTVGALLAATNDWLVTFDKGMDIGAVFFDITKAFDSVPHRLLINKLHHSGLNKYLLKWILSYLTDRKQVVVMDGVSSESTHVQSGVPQGSVLGPLLFLVYINEVCILPFEPSTKLILYADDILMYRPLSSQADFNHLQDGIDILNEWTEHQYLTFNPSKCKAMVLSRKLNTVSPANPLLLKGQALDFVDSIKYLGLTITSDLLWSRHIQQISNKARKLVGMLFRQFYNYTDKQTIKTLYLSIVRPHLEYACQVWDPHLEKDKNTLEKVQKFACKVCSKSWDTDYEDLLEELHLPTLETRRSHLKLGTFYNFVHGHSVPPFAINYRPSIDYSIRSHHNMTILQPYAHTNQYLHSFLPSTVSLWNKLPQETVNATSINSFKNSIKSLSLSSPT